MPDLRRQKRTGFGPHPLRWHCFNFALSTPRPESLKPTPARPDGRIRIDSFLKKRTGFGPHSCPDSISDYGAPPRCISPVSCGALIIGVPSLSPTQAKSHVCCSGIVLEWQPEPRPHAVLRRASFSFQPLGNPCAAVCSSEVMRTQYASPIAMCAEISRGVELTLN